MMKTKEKVVKEIRAKGFVYILVSFIIFCIVVGIGSFVKFENRIPMLKQYVENMDNKYENDQYGYTENEENKIKGNKITGDYGKQNETEFFSYMKFTKGDLTFIGLTIGIGWIILGIYWLYMIGYVMSKAFSVGANGYLFGGIALVGNVIGLIVLLIYIKLHLICPKCGKIQNRTANNCSLCGTAIFTICSDCGRRISVKDKYCCGCGRENENVKGEN